MKKVKNYIDADLAKKKLTRYKYWSIKDENGITIVSADDNPERKSFADFLDIIINDNVDAEVQVKYGTNEQSSRHNAPFFIKINQEIEWVDPVVEEPEQVTINGVKHSVDKNGNVNINLATPTKEQPNIESANIDYFRQELEMQLSGIRREHELKEEKMKLDLQNKLFEQTLTFKEMMLKDREAKIAEREQELAQQEAILEEKQREVRDDLKGYLNQVPTVLGGLLKEVIKSEPTKPLSGTKEEKEEPPKKRRTVSFTVEEGENNEIEEIETEDVDENQ